MDIRIGQGFDSHAFAKDRKLILGGVEIKYEFGLAGHSDADVLTHAIIDSLLGALALGNIGTWFPDNDLQYKNANSILLLKKVVTSSEFATWSIVNIDSTIIMDNPKLNPHIDKIRNNLAGALNIDTNNISVKPKTAEGLNWNNSAGSAVAIANTLLCKKNAT